MEGRGGEWGGPAGAAPPALTAGRERGRGGRGVGGGGGGRGERAVAAAVPRSGEGVSTPGDRTAGPRREVAASWRGLR